MENLGMNQVLNVEEDFWDNKRVFITGHTGFKGSWLTLWLVAMGAKVKGYALLPPTTPSLFETIQLEDDIDHQIGDVRDLSLLRESLQSFEPEIVIHMAAQPLVRYSYDAPVETYSTNVMGTVNILEAVRKTESVRVVVNVTTDKCYENREWVWGYRESEPMGGFDPYSSSKGCSELVTSAYRNSYFHGDSNVRLASARAGNVIGGGDWAHDRLIPDILRAFEGGNAVTVRNPKATRPWQHVLEPLSGYLILAQSLHGNDGAKFAEGWNFGPNDSDVQPVEWILSKMAKMWGDSASWELEDSLQPHEAQLLKLDISKARSKLLWEPRWSLEEGLSRIVSWHKSWMSGASMREATLEQIFEYRNGK